MTNSFSCHSDFHFLLGSISVIFVFPEICPFHLNFLTRIMVFLYNYIYFSKVSNFSFFIPNLVIWVFSLPWSMALKLCQFIDLSSVNCIFYFLLWFFVWHFVYIGVCCLTSTYLSVSQNVLVSNFTLFRGHTWYYSNPFIFIYICLMP